MRRGDLVPPFSLSNDFRNKNLDPIKNLAYAILERGCKDLHVSSSYWKRGSEHWIRREEPLVLFSFNWCCDLLQVNANDLREAVFEDTLHGELSREKREDRLIQKREEVEEKRKSRGVRAVHYSKRSRIDF